MAPVIQKFLFEGSSLISYGGRDVDSLIGYLDKNMLLLKGRVILGPEIFFPMGCVKLDN